MYLDPTLYLEVMEFVDDFRKILEEINWILNQTSKDFETVRRKRVNQIKKN